MKGAGNSDDFGMRLYDARIARFISIDPMKSRNSHESNYTYAANNPILFIDLEGGDNIVYLFMVKGGSLNPDAEKCTIGKVLNPQDIATYANKMFETMNMSTRVEVFEGTYAEFLAMQIDPTDVQAFVGHGEDLNKHLESIEFGHYFHNHTGVEESIDVSGGQTTAVQTHKMGKFKSSLSAESLEEVAAFGIVHGVAHCTGCSHVGEGCVNETYGDCRNPDYKTTRKDDLINYACSGPIVSGHMNTNKQLTMYSLMTPERCPLTILQNISRMEPARYKAICTMASMTARIQGGNSSQSKLLGNADFVRKAIQATTTEKKP